MLGLRLPRYTSLQWSSPVSRLRRWFALGAILMIAIVAGMYFYARFRVRKAVHDIPAKIALDIQQTAEGFSISKSFEGRTLFTVSASKAVQFKGGGRAELHNVKIVVYGKDASRFDRITGDDFEYEPASGNVSAKGTVLIDLEANPEGMRHSDQTPPQQMREPLHLEANGLIFNKNTGDAPPQGKLCFRTPQASGSAVGIRYLAKTGTMNLLSSVVMTVNRPQPFHLNADRGLISKQPRQVFLASVRLTQEQQQLQSEQATFFLRDDNTVDRVLAEGDVRGEFHGRSDALRGSDRAQLFLTGTRNLLTTAILSGNVRFTTTRRGQPRLYGRAKQGAQNQRRAARRGHRRTGDLHFSGQSADSKCWKPFMPKTACGCCRRRPSGTLVPSSLSAKAGEQDIELSAPAMDFIVKGGRLLERAETSGPPQILITQPGANQKTVVTAAKFTAKFTENNRLATLHGEPDAKIVSSRLTQ